MALEPVDSALHRVAGLVELRPPATAGTALLAVGDLVALLRDRAADAALAQVGTVRAGAVRLVGANPVRPGARAARPEPGYPNTPQDHLELRGVTALSGRDHQ
ncbi:hypothetical protein GCM10023084_79760 [Streptomyces lacrimifluminis]|uniref:Uncharacterized protein n=1 Tax=Streptomyces lacrimifluminis TaxID=1500077 RepID=A0A917UMR2_9ACTN|nr:hypothetical protein GCM10012282_77710 [Streptomyces lacrimifluminis]